MTKRSLGIICQAGHGDLGNLPEVGNDGGLIECAELEAAFGCAVNVGRQNVFKWKRKTLSELAGSSWGPSRWDKR